MRFPLEAEVLLSLNRRMKTLREQALKVPTNTTGQFLEALKQGLYGGLNHFLWLYSA